jgi:hypothetical protein
MRPGFAPEHKTAPSRANPRADARRRALALISLFQPLDLVTMNSNATVALAFLNTAGFAPAADAAMADRQWARTVKRLFTKGRRHICTPWAHRAELARAVAEQLGRACRVIRRETGFEVRLVG